MAKRDIIFVCQDGDETEPQGCCSCCHNDERDKAEETIPSFPLRPKENETMQRLWDSLYLKGHRSENRLEKDVKRLLAEENVSTVKQIVEELVVPSPTIEQEQQEEEEEEEEEKKQEMSRISSIYVRSRRIVNQTTTKWKSTNEKNSKKNHKLQNNKKEALKYRPQPPASPKHKKSIVPHGFIRPQHQTTGFHYVFRRLHL